MVLKYNALKLTEICCNFILANVDGLSSSLLDQLFKVMSFKGVFSFRWHGRQDPGCQPGNHIQKQEWFLVWFRVPILHHDQPPTKYPVLCKKNSAGNLVDEGALGRVVSFDLSGPLVKWTTGNTVTVSSQHPHPSCQHCPTGRDIVDWILLDQENFQKSPVNWSTYFLICIKSVGIFSRAYSESKLWCNDFFVQCPLALIPLWAFPAHHKTISRLY